MESQVALFRGYYMVGILMFILSLFWDWMDTAYGIVFFLVTINLIFVQEQVPVDIEHSAITHYQAYSRLNWLNIQASIYLIIAAFAFVFSPFDKGLTTLVIWTLFVVGVEKYLMQGGELLSLRLLHSYLQQNTDELNSDQIDEGIILILDNPAVELNELAEQLEISSNQAAEFKHYFERYIQENFSDE